ncbi:MAG: hypothetical protein HQL71_07060, partial [Magnetococcales bacterium]|nr:hypothetical protein [Magnetococcales bacterium]
MDVDPRFYGLHAFKSATEALASMLQTKQETTPAVLQEPESQEVNTTSLTQLESLPPDVPVKQTTEAFSQNSDLGNLLTNWAEKNKQVGEVKKTTIPTQDTYQEAITHEIVSEEEISQELVTHDDTVKETVTNDIFEQQPSQFIEVDRAQSKNLEKLLNPFLKTKTDKKTLVTESAQVEQPQVDEQQIEQADEATDLDLNTPNAPREIAVDTQDSFQKTLLAAMPVKNREAKEISAPEISNSNWVSKPTLDVQESTNISLTQKKEEKKDRVVENKEPSKNWLGHPTLDFDPTKSNIFNSLPIKVRRQIAERVNTQLSAQWTARQTIGIDNNTSAFILEENTKTPDNSAEKPKTSKANAQAPNLVLSTPETISIDSHKPSEDRSQEEIDAIIEAIKAEGRRMLQKQDEARLSALRQDATMLAAFDDIAASLQKSIRSSKPEDQPLISHETLK